MLTACLFLSTPNVVLNKNLSVITFQVTRFGLVPESRRRPGEYPKGHECGEPVPLLLDSRFRGNDKNLMLIV